MIFLRIFAVLLLVGINGFFAAAEFSLVAVRPSRIRLLLEQGDSRAKIVHELLRDLPLVVSGVQFGMSLASLGLGFVGEITLAVMMEQALSWIPGPWLALYAHSAAIALAFLLLTYMHVVLGELVPKTVSLQRAEGVALMAARPFSWFLRTFRPAINVLDTSAEKFSAWLGVRSPHSHTLVHSAEELRILIQQARERGLLQVGEEKFIQSAMELGQVQVREVMVPRPDIHMLPAEADMDEVLRVFATTQRSRLPVYQGTPDHILGFVHIKDMLWAFPPAASNCAASCATSSLCRKPSTPASYSSKCARAVSPWPWSWMNSAVSSGSSPWKISSNSSSAKFTMSST